MKNSTYIYLITAGLVTVFFLFTSELKAMQAAPAEISISHGSLAFPNIAVGATADEMTFTIENTGDETLNVTVQLVGAHVSQYAITSGGGSYSIPGSSTSDVSVVFSPTSIGSKDADVRIDHDATNLGSPQTVTLSGTGAPAILYVDQLATGIESGLNWTDAFTDLQDALGMAAEGASIWVAEGTYKPTSGTDRTVTFDIPDGVKLYGGFSGSEALLSERDWRAHITVLSGEIGSSIATDDNSYHVVTFFDTDSSTRLDGFTIRDGNADDVGLNSFGGGILCEGSSGKICSPVMTNLVLTDNQAQNGGGLANNGSVSGSSTPTLVNVVFLNNSSASGGTGGAIYNHGRAGDSSPVLKNITFFGNSASSGGAVANAGHDGGNSTPTYTNVIFWGNTSTSGDQVYNSDASPTLTNCVIENGLSGGVTDSGTSSTTDGGGNISSNPLLVSAVDLRLQPFSPAIDAGTADTTGLGLPATDLNGAVRVKGTVDIGAYESGLDLAVSGSEEWRMMASPLASQSYTDLLDPLWIQGITGADESSGTANIYTWDEATSSWQAPSGVSDTPGAGTGFVTYVFGDDDFDGTPDGFPKQLSATGSEPAGTVNIGVSSTDENSSTDIDGEEGWNLLGNPFSTPILVDEVLSAAATVDGSVSTNVHVWNPVTLVYDVFPQGNGHTIAPWQSFWIHYTAAGVSGNLTLDRAAAKTDSAAFQKDTAPLAGLSLTLSGPDQLRSTFKVIPDPDSEIGPDRRDAYRPAPLSAGSVSIYSNHEGTALVHNHLPTQLHEHVILPLAVEAPAGSGQLNLDWTREALPAGWTVELRDTRTGRVIGLDRDGSYTFEVERDQTSKVSETLEVSAAPPNGPIPTMLKDQSTNPRFLLTINPIGPGNDLAGLPEQVELTQNYPNPFNPETVIRYGVPEQSRVRLSVFDLLGRKVGTLVDGRKSAGRYEVGFDASELASGLYLYRLKIGSEVMTKKMMLIK